jgi:hypothetical protein
MGFLIIDYYFSSQVVRFLLQLKTELLHLGHWSSVVQNTS